MDQRVINPFDEFLKRVPSPTDSVAAKLAPEQTTKFLKKTLE